MSGTAKQTLKRQMMLGMAGIVAFVGVLFFGMWLTDPNRGKPDAREIARLESEEVVKNYKDSASSSLTPQDQWIAKSEEELLTYQQTNKALNERVKVLESNLQRLLDKPSHSVNKLNKPADPFATDKALSLDQALPSPDATTPLPPGGPQISSFGFDTPSPAPQPLAPKPPASKPAAPPPSLASPAVSSSSVTAEQVPVLQEEMEVFLIGEASAVRPKNVDHYLPAGSFVKVSLLSGVDATTGGESTQNPQPILMRLIDLGVLPNYFSSDIVDCHATGTVRGDISSERAKIRSEFLSCVLDNGDVAEIKIKGWVNGEDGKEGFRGRLVEKSGALIARSFVSGLFSGLGNSLASQYQTVSQNALGSVTTMNPGDAGKAGLAQGSSTALDKIADYYMARANEIFPIIEVSSNRIGELVLQQGVDFGDNIQQGVRPQ